MIERFSVRNFNPSADLEMYANSKLNSITGLALNNASITADLEKFGVGYHLKLRITSATEVFSFEALANDAKTAIDRLEKRISAACAQPY